MTSLSLFQKTMEKNKKRLVKKWLLGAVLAMLAAALMWPHWFLILVTVAVIVIVIALSNIKGTGTVYDGM
jgi:asparagine N-glycosylation enzyme membrane subunit Stt3